MSRRTDAAEDVDRLAVAFKALWASSSTRAREAALEWLWARHIADRYEERTKSATP